MEERVRGKQTKKAYCMRAFTYIFDPFSNFQVFLPPPQLLKLILVLPCENRFKFPFN